MMRTARSGLAVLLVAGGLVLSHSAVAGAIDSRQSEVRVAFSMSGVEAEGRITRYSGEIDFDPLAVRDAQAEISLQTGSFSSGDPDTDAKMREPQWLDSRQHPRAIFESAQLQQTGDDAYEALGTLSLKGIEQPMKLLFRYSERGGAQVFDGEGRLSRAAYGIGEEPWDTVLGDEIVIRFHIVVPKP